jgi:predicted DNA-binding transcriptional regulator AlpA
MSANLLTLPEFMSVADVAEWRGVTRACVYGWIKDGKIPVDHKRKGGGAMVRPSAVVEVFDGKQVGSDDDAGEVPNLNDERAWHEQAKRKKAELDLAARAAELLDAKEVQDTWTQWPPQPVSAF